MYHPVLVATSVVALLLIDVMPVEAGRRGRRARCVQLHACCPVTVTRDVRDMPACPCGSRAGRGKDPECLCIIQPYWDTGYYVLHYAHEYESCNSPQECVNEDLVIFAANEALDPEECPDCVHKGRPQAMRLDPKIDRPKATDYDLEADDQLVLPSGTYTFHEKKSGYLKTPRGDRIRVNSFRIDLAGEELDLTFAMEVVDDGSAVDFDIDRSRPHHTYRRYMYEFNLDGATYVVLASK